MGMNFNLLVFFGTPRTGTSPYRVVQAYENGTVTIQKAPFVTDRVNVRRIRPYYIDNED